MGKKRFVTFSVATSVAATRGVASQATSMIEAAMSAKLPAVGPSATLDAISDQLIVQGKSRPLATAQRG